MILLAQEGGNGKPTSIKTRVLVLPLTFLPSVTLISSISRVDNTPGNPFLKGHMFNEVVLFLNDNQTAWLSVTTKEQINK